MAPADVLKPTVLWAQRKDSIYIAVDIKDATGVAVQLDEASLDFKCQDGDGTQYGFVLDFFAAVRRQESKWSLKRCPEFVLKKDSDASWPRLQRTGKLTWIKVDWSKWADSDDEDEKGAFDTGAMEGMDFSSLSQKEVEEMSEDRDSILADLDEDIVVETEDEGEAAPTKFG
mmetsp:Transcript_3653/g.9301  ORF Transcript_3653/g.9301 Transcript_3653/m.9301 type:complete len:172 (-) Transcript_3653:82-597(-)